MGITASQFVWSPEEDEDVGNMTAASSGVVGTNGAMAGKGESSTQKRRLPEKSDPNGDCDHSEGGSISE